MKKKIVFRPFINWNLYIHYYLYNLKINQNICKYLLHLIHIHIQIKQPLQKLELESKYFKDKDSGHGESVMLDD